MVRTHLPPSSSTSFTILLAVFSTLPIVLRLILQQTCQRCQLQRVGAPLVEPSAAAQNKGRAQNVHHGGQPRGAESRRLRGAHGVEASGEADVPQQTFQKLWFGRERMSTRCEQMKREHCGPSSTPQIWETQDGGQRSWKMHAICQAIFQGVEGSEWEAMYHQCKDLHQVVKSKKSGENKKAKVLNRRQHVRNLETRRKPRNIFLRSGQ